MVLARRRLAGRTASFSRLASPLALLSIWIATCAVYLQVGQFGFVSWDDPLYVTGNAHVRQGLSLDGATWALTAHDDSNWLPLTWVSHMLDVTMFGGWAGGHHLTNLLLHLLDTALLFALLLSATRERWPSAFAAALFALHPLHVEVVAWISQRKELLSTAFGLLAMWAYVGWTRRGGLLRYAGMLLAYAAALASKAMLVTLPFLLLLLDVWPLGRARLLSRREAMRSLGRLGVEKLPLFAMSLAACAATFLAQELARTRAPDVPLALRIANIAVAYCRYLGFALWPSGLSVVYPHPYAPRLGGEPWPASGVAAAWIALAFVTALVLRATSRRYLGVGWLWFLGALVPVIGLVQVGPQGMADRYTYVALIGPFVAIAWAARDLLAALARGRRSAWWAGGLLATGLLVAAGVASHRRAAVWRDSETLYRASLLATPRSVPLLYNLAALQSRRGRIDEAIGGYQKVLAIDPENPDANVNLGNIRLRAGDTEAAIAHFRAALRGDPDDLLSLQNLGRVLRWRGDLAGARELLEHAHAIAPADASVNADLEAVRAAQESGAPGTSAAP
jgi:protein O-mannosyl-transferase